MGIRVPTQAVYQKVRAAFGLSVVIIGLSLISLITGIVGKRYIYGLIANLSPLLLPLLLYECLQQKLWGLDLLKAQCLIGTIYGLTLVIMDSIMLAFTVTNYRYCYGGWNDQCVKYRGVGSFDLLCTTSSTMTNTQPLLVTCMSEDIYALQFICLGFNLVHALFVAPYLLICHALKNAMGQSGWENGSMILFNPTPDIITTAVSRSIVILGNEEELDDGEIVDAVPAFSKGRYEEEMREELQRSHYSAKPTAR